MSTMEEYKLSLGEKRYKKEDVNKKIEELKKNEIAYKDQMNRAEYKRSEAMQIFQYN